MWALGDIALLIIDAGHDLRVARILLGRINAELHPEPEPANERQTARKLERDPKTGVYRPQ